MGITIPKTLKVSKNLICTEKNPNETNQHSSVFVKMYFTYSDI